MNHSIRNIKKHIQSLRQNMTNAEIRLWHFLRAKRFNGYKFRRQHLIFPYIVDFVCLNKRLIIEVDGGQHTEQVSYDEKRSLFLRSKGYQILRFWNDEVLKEIEGVLEVILKTLSSSPCTLSSI